MSEFIIKYNGDLLALGYPTEILSENYAIMELTEEEAKSILFQKEIEYIEPAKTLSLSVQNDLEYAYIPQARQNPKTDLTGKGVIIGIIDSGVDTKHPDFYRDNTTTILSLWDLTIPGNPPFGFLKGTVFSAEEIQRGECTSTDLIGHGTAVAGIAAGQNGAAPDASIVVVKLGDANTRTTDVMRGIKYVIDKGIETGMPCAINLSYGTNDGSHNGQSLFETYIDSIGEKWKNVIVCASGNEGFGGHHFSGAVRQGECLKVEFSVSPNPKILFLSLWKNVVDMVNYQLILPTGTPSFTITPYDRTVRSQTIDGIEIRAVYGRPSYYRVAQEVAFLISGPGDQLAGNWSLLCCGEKIVDGTFDIWLPTIEEVTEKTAFFRPDIELTLTLPSTARVPISVGGYNGATNTVSPFSGRGKAPCNRLTFLDLIAPAERIRSAKPGGGYGTFSGTSMAAPFVTGCCALLMEWGIVKRNDPFLYGQKMKAFLTKNADREPFVSYPDPARGYGRLNFKKTIDDLIRYAER